MSLETLITELREIVDNERIGSMPRKRLLRMSKRHCVSYTDSLHALSEEDIIERRGEVINLLIEPRRWHTYWGWRHAGYQVVAGAVAESKFIQGRYQKAFSNLQVKKIYICEKY